MEFKESTLEEMIKPLIWQVEEFCKTNDLEGLVVPDHVCIKCSTSEVYERRRAKFEHESHFVFQSLISGRRISIVSLLSPVATSLGTIKYVELSDQKSDGSQIDCIDHIELVPRDTSLESVLEKIKNNELHVEKVVRPHHTTHEITLPSGFTIKFSEEFLIDKIKREEMN